MIDPTVPALLPPQGSNYIPWQERWRRGWCHFIWHLPKQGLISWGNPSKVPYPKSLQTREGKRFKSRGYAMCYVESRANMCLDLRGGRNSSDDDDDDDDDGKNPIVDRYWKHYICNLMLLRPSHFWGFFHCQIGEEKTRKKPQRMESIQFLVTPPKPKMMPFLKPEMPFPNHHFWYLFVKRHEGATKIEDCRLEHPLKVREVRQISSQLCWSA